jgi:hypothetical protein
MLLRIQKFKKLLRNGNTNKSNTLKKNVKILENLLDLLSIIKMNNLFFFLFYINNEIIINWYIA